MVCTKLRLGISPCNARIPMMILLSVQHKFRIHDEGLFKTQLYAVVSRKPGTLCKKSVCICTILQNCAPEAPLLSEASTCLQLRTGASPGRFDSTQHGRKEGRMLSGDVRGCGDGSSRLFGGNSVKIAGLGETECFPGEELHAIVAPRASHPSPAPFLGIIDVQVLRDSRASRAFYKDIFQPFPPRRPDPAPSPLPYPRARPPCRAALRCC